MSQQYNSEEEKKFFAELLKIPGARKAKQGVLLETPEGTFHARGIRKSVSGLPDEAQFYLEFCTENEARRIFNVRNIHDYVLKKRADIIADSPRLIRSLVQKRNEWEIRNRRWTLTGYYSTLNGEASEYIQSLSKSQRKIYKTLVYGRAPMEQPNGFCFRSILGDIVLVSDTLREFFYFYTLSSIGFYYGLNLEQRVHAFLIALRIMIGKESQDFDLDPREQLSAKIRAEVSADVGWMLQFTFAHEFAHFRLGHLDAIRKSDEDEVIFAHQLEYEADLNALTLHGHKSERTSRLTWAAHQVFLSFHALERVGIARADFPNFSVSQTHPRPTDRIEAIEDVRRRNRVADREIIDDAIKSTNSFVDLVLERIERDHNVFSKYGSMYLPGFKVGNLVDRIDF